MCWLGENLPHAQTGFTRQGASLQYNYQQRRTALRQSWFPADQESLDQLQRETSLVLRFVIGHSKLYSAEQDLSAEAKRHGGFLRLPMQACVRYLRPEARSPNVSCTGHPQSDNDNEQNCTHRKVVLDIKRCLTGGLWQPHNKDAELPSHCSRCMGR